MKNCPTNLGISMCRGAIVRYNGEDFCVKNPHRSFEGNKKELLAIQFH